MRQTRHPKRCQAIVRGEERGYRRGCSNSAAVPTLTRLFFLFHHHDASAPSVASMLYHRTYRMWLHCAEEIQFALEATCNPHMAFFGRRPKNYLRPRRHLEQGQQQLRQDRLLELPSFHLYCFQTWETSLSSRSERSRPTLRRLEKMCLLSRGLTLATAGTTVFPGRRFNLRPVQTPLLISAFDSERYLRRSKPGEHQDFDMFERGKKAKRGKAKKDYLLDQAPWWEVWADGEEDRIVSELSKAGNSKQTVLIGAAKDFQTGRLWPPPRNPKTDPIFLWGVLLAYLGITSKLSVTKSRKGKGFRNPPEDDEDEQSLSDDDDAPDPDTGNPASKRLQQFLTDPESVLKDFLSFHFREKGLSWYPANLEQVPRLCSFFLNFLLRCHILPDLDLGLRAAIDIANQALIELPLTRSVSENFPEGFGRGCAQLWDHNATLREPQPSVEHIIEPGGPTKVKEGAGEAKLFDWNGGLGATTNAGWGGSANQGKEWATTATEGWGISTSRGGGWGTTADEGWGGSVSQGGGWGTTEDGWTGPSSDGLSSTPRQDWATASVNEGGEWRSRSRDGNSSASASSPRTSDSTDFPSSLMRFLGPTALPLSHVTGVVERSVRKIIDLDCTRTNSCSNGNAIDNDLRLSVGGPAAVESTLEAQFSRIVLSPCLDWDGGRCPGIAKPEVLAASDGTVLDPDTGLHDPDNDPITVLIDPAVSRYLRVGMLLGGTWVQIVRRPADPPASPPRKRRRVMRQGPAVFCIADAVKGRWLEERSVKSKRVARSIPERTSTCSITDCLRNYNCVSVNARQGRAIELQESASAVEMSMVYSQQFGKKMGCCYRLSSALGLHWRRSPPCRRTLHNPRSRTLKIELEEEQAPLKANRLHELRIERAMGRRMSSAEPASYVRRRSQGSDGSQALTNELMQLLEHYQHLLISENVEDKRDLTGFIDRKLTGTQGRIQPRLGSGGICLELGRASNIEEPSTSIVPPYPTMANCMHFAEVVRILSLAKQTVEEVGHRWKGNAPVNYSQFTQNGSQVRIAGLMHASSYPCVSTSIHNFGFF
ncbi:hypothetical protein NMY22_g13729 [Coprinellus aureogranulatus]|nr:hypothetical protein NMY22_g13729 [Coprinellus aureogranulatus]